MAESFVYGNRKNLRVPHSVRYCSMLYINSTGDMYLRAGALRSLNASVLHVVATAVDSGAPPRQVRSPFNLILYQFMTSVY